MMNTLQVVRLDRLSVQTTIKIFYFFIYLFLEKTKQNKKPHQYDLREFAKKNL